MKRPGIWPSIFVICLVIGILFILSVVEGLGFMPKAVAVTHKWEMGQESVATSRLFTIRDGTLVGLSAIRLAIDINGNVGIGTTTPLGKLDVNGTLAVEGTYEGLSSAAYPAPGKAVYKLLGIRDSASTLGGFGMLYETMYESPIIYGYDFNSSQNNNIIFGSLQATNRNLAAGLTPRMVINMNSGNVGIGTTDATSKLTVRGTAEMTAFKLTTGATNGYVLTSNTNGIGTWQTAGGGTQTGLVQSTASGTSYFTGGSVGIGTTTPASSAKLDINVGTVGKALAVNGKEAIWYESSTNTFSWGYDGSANTFGDPINCWGRVTGSRTQATESIGTCTTYLADSSCTEAEWGVIVRCEGNTDWADRTICTCVRVPRATPVWRWTRIQTYY
jgi:hypothetical protein